MDVRAAGYTGRVNTFADEELAGQLPYKVICTWCGETIRLNARQDIEAMCRRCYRQMLFEHTRINLPADAAEGVSAR